MCSWQLTAADTNNVANRQIDTDTATDTDRARDTNTNKAACIANGCCCR